ncbi:MAG: hypothetical protein VB913_01155 [Rhodospirillales bacterium]
MNSVTQEQLEGISNYFAPASVSATTSGAGGILGGQTMSEEGSEISARAKPTVSLELPPPKTGLGGEAMPTHLRSLLKPKKKLQKNRLKKRNKNSSKRRRKNSRRRFQNRRNWKHSRKAY